MSDWGAVADHVAAIKAGLDLEMPGKGQVSVNEIVTAVKAGRLQESNPKPFSTPGITNG